MRLAAIETATAATAVAVGEDDEVEEVLADDRRRHTEALAPALAGLLAARGWAVEDLDVVVVDVGPGLFTGLRVGLATAKGLSLAAGVGLVAVSSTDVLAQAAGDATVTGTVVSVLDVRRGEVVAARHRCGPDGAAELEAPLLLTPVELAARLAESTEPLVVVGDGATRYRDVLDVEGVSVRDDLVVPSPASAIRLARHRLARGIRPVGHGAVHPWYVREADAVANFTVRDGST
jgi:tRNA threonylcarbamoyladenosine biosynthesis protein TsaB